jgi:hypothetical protein
MNSCKRLQVDSLVSTNIPHKDETCTRNTSTWTLVISSFVFSDLLRDRRTPNHMTVGIKKIDRITPTPTFSDLVQIHTKLVHLLRRTKRALKLVGRWWVGLDSNVGHERFFSFPESRNKIYTRGIEPIGLSPTIIPIPMFTTMEPYKSLFAGSPSLQTSYPFSTKSSTIHRKNIDRHNKKLPIYHKMVCQTFAEDPLLPTKSAWHFWSSSQQKCLLCAFLYAVIPNDF